MPIPPGLYGWYKTAYPTLTFNPGWLEACVEYLQESDSTASNTPGLIKAVEKQLLSSDLSTSVQLSSLSNNRLLLSSIHSASSSEQDKVLYRGGTKKSWLFQIQQVDDISHSAQSLIEVLQEKREWRKLKLKGGNMDGGRLMRLDDEEQGNGDEEEKLILAGGTGKEPIFPRGSGKFVLSDGENLVNAFELQRIQGLGLEEVRLGSKILVHDVTFIDGVMLLTPQNTVVKGHDVEELQQLADWSLENTLRQRLDLEPLPKPDQVNASPAPRSPSPKFEEMDQKPALSPPPPRNATRARPGPSTASTSRAKPSTSSSSSNRAKAAPAPPVASTYRSKPAPARQAAVVEDEDDYFDDSFDYDALEAQAQSQVAAPASSRGKGKGRAIDTGEFDQDEDMEDDEAWNAMNEVEMRPPQHNKPPQAGGGVKVKDESRSSGSRQKLGIGGSKGGKTEVLELDSDDDEEEPSAKPVRKKLKAEGNGVKKELGGKKKKDVVVLEIDDSD